MLVRRELKNKIQNYIELKFEIRVVLIFIVGEFNE